MKKFYLLAAAAATLMGVACNKNIDTPELSVPDMQAGKALVALRVAPGSNKAQTRAAGDAVADTQAERTINTLDVFYINHATKLIDSYAGTFTQDANAADGATIVNAVKVTNVPMDIWVIANAPAALKESILDEASLKSAVSAFTQNTADNLVMVGYKENVNLPVIQATTREGKEYKLVDGIVLERMVNKVTVGKIVKAFRAPALQAATVSVEGMYIVNAVKEARYTAKIEGADAVPAAAVASYFNTDVPFEQNELITFDADPTAALEVTANGTDLNKSFYFYPNPAVEANAVSENDFVTKLVLKVRIGQKFYWYPIGIVQNAADARNLVYQIDTITLRGLGNDPDQPHKPNDYIDEANVEVQLTVKDWVAADLGGSFNDWMVE